MTYLKKKKKRKKSGQNENSSSETEKKQKMSAQNCEIFDFSNQIPSEPTGTDNSIGRIKGGLISKNFSIQCFKLLSLALPPESSFHCISRRLKTKHQILSDFFLIVTF